MYNLKGKKNLLVGLFLYSCGVLSRILKNVFSFVDVQVYFLLLSDILWAISVHIEASFSLILLVVTVIVFVQMVYDRGTESFLKPVHM